ncbi:4947_t:CDS:2, partial [Gigaspora rosea]
MAFKIVGRSKSKKEALELGEAYRLFIKSLPLMEITKDSLCKPMTTNNLTERINKSVEGRRVGTQPINSFIESGSGNILEFKNYRTLITTIQATDGYEMTTKSGTALHIVALRNSGFRSPYTMRKINIDNKSFELLQQMIDKLASKHSVMQQNDYYLVNISTGECTCLDFIWNSSFRDICKHECAMPKEQKNLIIYSNSVDAVFKEILRSYM